MNYLFSNRDLKRLILPLIVEQFLQCFVGLADSLMVATVGEAAISAVSLVDTIFMLLINVFAALGTGGAVIAGQALGRKDEEGGCIAANQLILFVAMLAAAIMILVYMGRSFLLGTVFGRIEADVMSNSSTYLLIVAASIPFIAVYNAGAAIFRAMGNSRVSMYSALIMNAINLAGNALLIFGFHRGIEGVAIPTLISRVVACGIILKLLANPEWKLHLPKPFRFRPDTAVLKKILYIGVPNGLENGMFHLGKILVLSLVASFGTASIAANAVAGNVVNFAFLPGTAIGYAMLTVVAQCAGAQDYSQARFYVKKLLKLDYLVLLVSNGLVVLLMFPVLHVYNLSPEATVMARDIILYYCLCCITIWPLSFTIPNALRAASDVKFTMIVAIVSMWIFRIAFSYVLGVWCSWGLFGVWVAMTIDWLFRGILFVFRYLGGKWQKSLD